MITIIGNYGSPYVRKVLAALAIKGVEYEIDPIVPFFGGALPAARRVRSARPRAPGDGGAGAPCPRGADHPRCEHREVLAVAGAPLTATSIGEAKPLRIIMLSWSLEVLTHE